MDRDGWDPFGWDMNDEDERDHNKVEGDNGFPSAMVQAVIGALVVILIIWACVTIPAA